jgi:hypothetical protein
VNRERDTAPVVMISHDSRPDPTLSSAVDRLAQPSLGAQPVAFDRTGRHGQRVCRFHFAVARKKAALHDLTQTGTLLGQPFQGVVDGKQVLGLLLNCQNAVVERDVRGAGATLGRRAHPRVVHDHLAHRARGNREEVAAVPGTDACLVYELEVGLVDEADRTPPGRGGPVSNRESVTELLLAHRDGIVNASPPRSSWFTT